MGINDYTKWQDEHVPGRKKPAPKERVDTDHAEPMVVQEHPSVSDTGVTRIRQAIFKHRQGER